MNEPAVNDHDVWIKGALPMVKNGPTVLIHKQANRFKTGQVLYLVGCDTGRNMYGVLRGAFMITEVKHQSDTGVSFFLRHQFVGTNQPWAGPSRSYLVEFARTQKLYRLSGPPVSFIIEEGP